MDKGFYYKFNCSNEIKLIKFFLEDNGFLAQPYKIKQMSTTFQMAHGGNKEVKKEGDDWLVLWSTKPLKMSQYGHFKKFQKVNQFPKSFELTRKDLLVESVQKMQEIYGISQLDFLPVTYTLPREVAQLQLQMAVNPAQYWIIKPSSSSQGKGIFITNSFADVVQNRDTLGNSVASHYISNPLLIDQLKFDLRVYVALTSVYPLKVYVYEEGLARFATTKYRPPGAADSGASLNNREGKFCHLTNYSLNKLNKKGFKQGSADDELSGSKWSLKALRKVLRSNGIDDKAVFQKIYDVINKTFLSVDPVLRQAHAQYVQGKSNCFQLFGFDILIDNKLNPWLLEVNLSPSLACESLLDQ